MSYDSAADTLAHIRRVQTLLADAARNLTERGIVHDRTKLEYPEKAYFDLVTPRLAKLEYGTPEYRASLRDIKPAIEHHYRFNPHHPEYWTRGIAGMSLFDVLEMLIDWKAASERHETGDIRRSLDHNVERFGIDPQLARILGNTIDEFGW